MNFTPERIRGGEGLKRVAHEFLEQHRAVTILRGRRWMLTLRRDTAMIDEVREMVELAYGVNPVYFGAGPSTLAKAGIIEPDGFTKSRRRDAHARPLTVWRLADRGGGCAGWACIRTDPTHRKTPKCWTNWVYLILKTITADRVREHPVTTAIKETNFVRQ